MVSDTTNTNSIGLKTFVDRNSCVWLAVLTTSIALAITSSPFFLLMIPGVLILDDILVFFGRSWIFDSERRIRRNYQWMHNMYDNTTGSGRDLGFNLIVDGEKLSQTAKFEHMVKELKLKPGMSICDVGCGYGDWLRYCRDVVGCNVVGINISQDQADFAIANYKLDIVVSNWKDVLTKPEIQEKLYAKFDAVTFMDTVEHYVSMEDRNDLPKQRTIYSNMCLLASNLLKVESDSGRVFIPNYSPRA